MKKAEEVKMSKFLSLVLRHNPQTIGLALDEKGWADTEELLSKCRRKGIHLDRDTLTQIVANNDKKRFAFNADGSRIRASQGHSVAIELGYPPVTPPSVLYHGTALRFLDSIRENGLVKGQRHHVHLSDNADTATKVGTRHGKPIVLTIQAERMAKDGYLFYRSANGVWLTDLVAPTYLVFGQE